MVFCWKNRFRWQHASCALAAVWALCTLALTGCNGFDNDEAYQPQAKDTWLLVQPQAGGPSTVLHHGADGSWTLGWETTLGLTQASAIAMKDNKLWIASSVDGKIVQYDAEDGKVNHVLNTPFAPANLCVGKDKLMAADTVQRLLAIWPATDDSPDYTLWRSNLKPQCMLASNGRFYVSRADTVLSVFNEDAETETLREYLNTRIYDIQRQPLYNIAFYSTDTATQARYATTVYAASDVVAGKELPFNGITVWYTPYLTAKTGAEYIGSVAWLTDSTLNPGGSKAPGGAGVDFGTSRLYSALTDEIRVVNLKAAGALPGSYPGSWRIRHIEVWYGDY